jgi:hypothetical protein
MALSARVALACSVLLVVGCAAPTRTLREGKYTNTDYGLSVAPRYPATQGPLSDDWLVDNFYRDGREWQPKLGGEYEVTYELDLDGDGHRDVLLDAYRYELKLEHRHHDGVITLQLLPLSDEDAQKRLDVLLRRYVDGLSGGGYSLNPLSPEPEVVEKRFAASLQSARPAQIAGLQGYGGIVGVRNVDQAVAGVAAGEDLVEIVLAYPPLAARMGDKNGRTHDFHLLLVALYANRADEFAKGLDDFHTFLSAIEFED